jgi:hypothetical protein
MISTYWSSSSFSIGWSPPKKAMKEGDGARAPSDPVAPFCTRLYIYIYPTLARTERAMHRFIGLSCGCRPMHRSHPCASPPPSSSSSSKQAHHTHIQHYLEDEEPPLTTFCCCCCCWQPSLSQSNPSCWRA